jgi:tRNA uridine 5-carbamoylmethylation protein Kti12
MNPIDLITPELIEICKDKKLIVVCGYTKTGKVTIAKKLAEELNRKLLKSDDYQMFEEQSLEMLMNDVIDSLKRKEQIIVEGILCFRLLRKGMEQMNILPDMLIKILKDYNN